MREGRKGKVGGGAKKQRRRHNDTDWCFSQDNCLPSLSSRKGLGGAQRKKEYRQGGKNEEKREQNKNKTEEEKKSEYLPIITKRRSKRQPSRKVWLSGRKQPKPTDEPRQPGGLFKNKTARHPDVHNKKTNEENERGVTTGEEGKPRGGCKSHPSFQLPTELGGWGKNSGGRQGKKQKGAGGEGVPAIAFSINAGGKKGERKGFRLRDVSTQRRK